MDGGALATGSYLAKQLASCNKSTRDKAIKLLKTWLPSQNEVSDEELKKIWKGLFYCIWHADKQPVQIELINRLSSLLVTLDLSLSIQYFEVFLITIRREWSGIDYLRLDKFYLLIRKFLHQLFNLLKKNSWDLELCNRLMSVLEVKTLFSDDKFPAQGVNYHISEVFLEELKPFLPIRLEAVEVLLKPFLSVMQKSLDKVLLSKIKSNMFDFLLKNGKELLEKKKSGDCSESGGTDEVDLFGTIGLALCLSTKFFDLGSSSDCLQGNRKVIFGLHEDFSKFEKDLANSGVEISVPKVMEVDEDEVVPALIPIPEMEVGTDEVLVEQVEVDTQISNGLADKPSKKKGKKAKKESGETKKSKKKKNGLSDSVVLEDKENEFLANGDNSTNDGDFNFDETVISNLQMQFERVAAEVGMELEDSGDVPTLPVKGTVSKKRKRARSAEKKGSISSDQDVVGVGSSAVEKSGEKSAKKVRFSMKSNLVWKPHSPLPPQSLRLPPSATPRGSALKKGLSPGPIRELAVLPKKVVKKVRKGPKGVAPAIKRLRKLRTR